MPFAQRQREADEFFAALQPADLTADERAIQRQAWPGMSSSKQSYHYCMARCLEGDAGQPPPPASRRRGHNRNWAHLNTADILSMPGKWEYPWFAAWDLAFHCPPLARLDPEFAKQQLILLGREWYQHPKGQAPAHALLARLVSRWMEPGMHERRLLAVLRGSRMKRVLRGMLDQAEFLSSYGVRTISRYHADHPYTLEAGGQRLTVAYLPAESDSGFFGGNSNWRGHRR